MGGLGSSPASARGAQTHVSHIPWERPNNQAGGYLGWRILLHPCFETAQLCSEAFQTQEAGLGWGRARRERVPDAETSLWGPSPGSGEPRGCLLAPLTFVIWGGLHADCGLWHPTSSSLLGTMTLGKASSKSALRWLERVFPPRPPRHPRPRGHFPVRQQAGSSFAPLPLALRVPTHVPSFGAGAATALHGEGPGMAIGACWAPKQVKYHFSPCQGGLGGREAPGCPVLAALGTPWSAALGTWVTTKVKGWVFLGFPDNYKVKWQ